jgi:hypothetical protein
VLAGETVAATAPAVAATTANNAAVAPLGSAPPPAPWAATASAAVNRPVVTPRTRSTGSAAGLDTSDQAEPSHQIGVDAVQLFGDGGMSGTALRHRHILGCRDGG